MDNRKIIRLAYSATVFAFIVVVLGAYTRLTDAGLGCPDWPGCYGQLVPETNTTNPLINTTKAWTEMIHRYLAGSLGMIIFALAFFITKNKSRFKKQSQILAIAVSILVIFQGLLGMWTVTLKLFPLVVMAHLLGGLATLSLLWWLTLTLQSHHKILKTSNAALRAWGIIGLTMLIIQIFLGGWTSANYAALVCLDFPFCNHFNQNSSMHFELTHLFEAFHFMEAGVTGSPGTPLGLTARVIIHMLHRLGAILTTIIVAWLGLLAWIKLKDQTIRKVTVAMISLLVIQLLLGITNILALLPLPIAVAHNAVAALLLLSIVTLNYFIYEK